MSIASWALSFFGPLRRAERERLAQELAQVELTRRRLLDAIDLLPHGLVILDEERRYVAWNKEYAAIYSATADLLVVGGKLEDAVRAGLARGEYPEAVGHEEDWLAARLRKLEVPGPRHEQALADGRCIMIEDRLMPDGSMVSLRVDISEIKQREASFRLLFDSNPVPMFVCDPETWAVRAANSAAISHYGYSSAALAGMTFFDVHGAVDLRARDSLQAWGVASFKGQSFQHVCRDGRLIEVEVRASELPFEGKPAVLLACIDITERRLNELRVLHMSRHDPLTNLPNRSLLNERLAMSFDASEAFSLMFLDLDGFKGVNDTMGHGVGDELLVQVARRLKSCVRGKDLVARLGGDEFAVLVLGRTQREDLEAVAQRIIETLNQPFIVAGREVSVGVSVGVALAPHHGGTAADLVRAADLAMYATKAKGRNTFSFFEESMGASAVARVEIEADLKRAVVRNEFEVHYQPIIDLATGKELCREALVRWRHPEKGLVPPIQFIPIAEETGLIQELSDIVMRRACLDAATWPDGIKVSVNVSAVELNDVAIVERVRLSLKEAKLEPRRLQVEVTETAVMNNFELSSQLLKDIRAMGVEIVMDDFGTGYSSLSFLRLAPIDKLKIDRSFIKDIETAAGRTMVSTILEMANALGIRTTAEGVETPEQNEVLKQLHCLEAQGYLYGRPQPPTPDASLAA